MSEPILFEDTFTITSLNKAKYERVSRISAISTSTAAASNSNVADTSDNADPNPNDTTLNLDVNTELYPLNVNDRVQLALALTLNLDGSKDDSGGSGGSRGAGGWRDVSSGEKRTLADEYDYVCYGKIYRFEEGTGDDISVYVSFGGLLLNLEGPYAKLNPLRIDHIYLLMKR